MVPVRLIERIQASFTALGLGKVSYLVFRVIHIIELHELDANLIFNHILGALTITSFLHLLFRFCFFPGRINETPNCAAFVMIGSLLFQSIFLAPLFYFFKTLGL